MSEPVPIRLAATVVLQRADGALLLMQRSKDSKFFPGAYVFPGGAVEASDAGADAIETFKRAAARECQEEVGLLPPLWTLAPWARWVTPQGEARRYDTLFFVAPLPDGQVRLARAEGDAVVFARPEEVLARFAAAEIALAPPTLVVVAELSETPLRAAREPVGEIRPIRTEVDGRPALLLPGDPLHPEKPPRPWPRGVGTRIFLDAWPKWTFAGT